MSETVRVETVGTTCTITLNRPERKNALTRAMYTAICDALDAAAQDKNVRAVAFFGEGSAFSAGNDLMDFIQEPPTGPKSPVFRFLLTLLDYEKPVLAGVQGPGIGIGTTMLLHMDHVVVAEDVRLQMPFTKLGLVPEAGSSLIIPQLVGSRVAAELLLFGEAMDADAAVRHGIANRKTTTDALKDTVLAQAEKLAALPPAAVRLSKSLIHRGHKEAVRETMLHEGELFAERLTSPEAVEAMTAFMEKRAPNFAQFE